LIGNLGGIGVANAFDERRRSRARDATDAREARINHAYRGSCIGLVFHAIARDLD